MRRAMITLIASPRKQSQWAPGALAPMARAIVHQRGSVRLEIGDQVMEMVSQRSKALNAADALGLNPAVDAGRLD
jgi:hypothetical protein